MYQIKKSDIDTYVSYINMMESTFPSKIKKMPSLGDRALRCASKFKSFLIENKETENEKIDIPTEYTGAALHTIGMVAESRGHQAFSNNLKKKHAELIREGHLCSQFVAEYLDRAEDFRKIHETLSEPQNDPLVKKDIGNCILQYLDLLKSRKDEYVDIVIPKELFAVHLMIYVARALEG